MIVRYMQENVAQLGVASVDLALLHHPPGRPSGLSVGGAPNPRTPSRREIPPNTTSRDL
jgi:hypothetical protein